MASAAEMPDLISDSDTSDSDSESSGPGPSPAFAGFVSTVSARVSAAGAEPPPSRPSPFPGRSYHDFDSFPADEIQECCVCLTTPSDGRICQLHCSHVFHAGCIDTWLNDSNTCPTCRNVVDPLRVMPSAQGSFPPGFPQNWNEFAQFFFGMANPFAGPSASGQIGGHPAAPGHSGRPSQLQPPIESQMCAAVETLTSYLRGRFHVNASSAARLDVLANAREILSSLPTSTTLRQVIDSRPDLFHVVQQGSAFTVYVEPQPVSSFAEPLRQCTAAISSYLESGGHTSPFSAVPLAALCDVPSIRRSLPSTVTLSNAIRSSPEFVLVESQLGASVYRRISPATPPQPHLCLELPQSLRLELHLPP